MKFSLIVKVCCASDLRLPTTIGFLATAAQRGQQLLAVGFHDGHAGSFRDGHSLLRLAVGQHEGYAGSSQCS